MFSTLKKKLKCINKLQTQLPYVEYTYIHKKLRKKNYTENEKVKYEDLWVKISLTMNLCINKYEAIIE